jgi:hypothetical protein
MRGTRGNVLVSRKHVNFSDMYRLLIYLFLLPDYRLLSEQYVNNIDLIDFNLK